MYLANEFKEALAGLRPLAILHVGAHLGEEAECYAKLGAEVLWVEANPRLMPQLRLAVARASYQKQRAIEGLLSDVAGEVHAFHVANNGQSSSMLPLKDHLKSHPEVSYVEEMRLTTTTLDMIAPPGIYNALNLDVQGAEMKAVRGGPRMLKSVQVVYAEVNFREMYEGCSLIDEFDRELLTRGFERTATHDTGAGWGDAIYRRIS